MEIFSIFANFSFAMMCTSMIQSKIIEGKISHEKTDYRT